MSMNNNINSNNNISNNNSINRKRTNDIEIKDNITFSELLLQKEVLKGLEDAGYQRPSPIQLKAIPLGISGVDLIAQAKSGTGKTIVFGVIALECVLRESKLLREKQQQQQQQQANGVVTGVATNKELLEMDDDTYCETLVGVIRKPLVLIIAPTREIAVQIKDVIKVVGKYCKRVKCEVFIGGLANGVSSSSNNQDNDLNKLNGTQIIVGTPGRIKSLIENLHLRTDTLKMLILDEADKLLDASFSKTINWIYTSCCLPSSSSSSSSTSSSSSSNGKPQILAFSATYPNYLINILQTYMNKPSEIRLCSDTPSLEGIKQYYQCFNIGEGGGENNYKIFQEKVKSTLLILEQVSFYQAIIFCNHKIRAEELSRTLNREGWPTSFIAGGQDQRERLATMAALKSFNIRILISTDLISRGIDVERVNLVLNLDLPKDHETYFHRIGRTGRFGTYGVSITFLNSKKQLEKDTTTATTDGHHQPLLQEIDFINQLIQDYNVDITERFDNDIIPEELYTYQLSNENDQQSLENLKQIQKQTILINKQLENFELNKEEEEEEEEDEDDDDEDEDYEFIDDSIIEQTEIKQQQQPPQQIKSNNNKSKNIKNNYNYNNHYQSQPHQQIQQPPPPPYGYYNDYYNNNNYQNYYNNNNNNNYYHHHQQRQQQQQQQPPININNPYGFNIPTPNQYSLNQFYYCTCPNCPNMNYHTFK